MENGVVGGLIEEVGEINPARIDRLIVGETFIKPKGVYEYKYTGLQTAQWYIDTSKYPIEYKVINDRIIKLRWLGSYSGQFDIIYGDTAKTIVVESLF